MLLSVNNKKIMILIKQIFANLLTLIKYVNKQSDNLTFKVIVKL